MAVVRAWSWTRIDGRNVLAVPTQTEIRLYDSDDFILLSRLAPSGHRSPVAFVRWSVFHGKLASLSSDRLLVHAPQRDPQERSSVHFAVVCRFRLDAAHASIRGLAFSRSADELLFCGPDAGVGKLDVRAAGSRQDQALVLWESETAACDIAKYSPSAFVFATLKTQEKQVRVWRMRRRLGDPDQSQTLDRVETLGHPDPVVYFSWKPSTTQWHSALETDGSRKAQWFEPARILLTCTATRSVRIWTERERREQVELEPVLLFEPTYPMDNVRWVLSKNRNISDENFQVVNDAHDNHADWISGVDQHGVLRLWRVVGLVSENPAVEETTLQIKVNGEEDQQRSEEEGSLLGVRLGDVCVMAYFSQNYFGMPSKLGIVLQRADHIMMSFHVAVGEGDRPSQVLKKSWHRSHLGSISALSTHPSLPLIASVDAHPSESDGTWRNEILVYWISFSAFSAESRLIPSGVLPCEKGSGEVLCIQWVPTLHFDATPLLLVAFESGVIDVYGRSARADVAVVSSPRVQLPQRHRKLTRSPSLSPWTFYDYVTGESGYEYEVACEKPTSSELEIQFEEKKGKLLVSRNTSSNKYLGEVVEGDELVGINNKSVVGKDVKEVLALIEVIPPDESLLMRFRAACVHQYQGTMRLPVCETSSQSTTPASFQETFNSTKGGGMDAAEHSVEEDASHLRRSFLSSLEKQNPQSPRSMDNVVHAGAVSMYGGWKQLLHMKAAPKLSLLCVCPAYADDGEYVPDSVLIFGIESLPGKIRVWKGVRDGAYHSFELVPLQIQDPAIEKKANITSIAGERDYRQRAFSSKRVQGRNSLNSLLFIGDAGGNIEHWRCQIVVDVIHFTMMSSHPVCSNTSPPSPNGDQAREPSGSFCRRGYVSADQVENSRQSGEADTVVVDGISHIEVDDPNRLAVLHSDRPEELHVFEAESGLGIMRPEESIPSNGRGRILGFTWCNSHVEFNVDALAVRYESATVIYQYDTNLHCWSQIGDDIVSPLPLFDCTRDSSALLIGGGHLKDSRLEQPSFQPISNEMPVVIGKWDEPGSLLQHSMDWKAAESPQKLPVWHPYVLLTTMFGMHARVGEKDTSLAGDRASYKFSRAFKDATQMLKLLAKVMEDEPSARASASSGVLSYTGPGHSKQAATKENGSGRARMLESVGRYSTSIHRSDKIDKAENLFAAPMSRGSQRRYNYEEDTSLSDEDDQRTLASGEAATILTAIDSMLLGKTCSLQANASVLFASFSEEHLLEMKALLSFVDEIQSLGFDLDASAADLGAKRFFSMHLFAKSLRSVVLSHTGTCGDSPSNPQNGDFDPFSGKLKWRNSYSERESCFWLPSLEETPSSGLLWALHSDAQQFLWEHCIDPRMQWEDIRPLWLGLWIKDVKDLRGIVERFAKVSYTRTKDAMDVCLLYVALGKKKVLSALATLTQSESNKTLASFLDNDFSEKRWSNAAIRNAYSLLSKKNYATAAAFFLLCEPPRIQDAIRVLSVRLGDPSLALVIARLVEYQIDDKVQHDFTTRQAGITPAGDITKQLLEQDVIPLFRRKREVWLESCALWWLEEFEQAWAVLLPQFQDVDVGGDNERTLPTKKNLVSSVMRATHFYINLTSLTVYFQHLHSSVNSSLLSWAKKKMQLKAFPDVPVSPTPTSLGKRRLQLASTADIEHAFSFAAYVCKRSGLSDTALVEMLQARHLVNVHARFEISTVEAESDPISELQELSGVSGSPTSPRFQSSLKSWRRGSQLSCITSPIASKPPRQRTWSMSSRRMSFMDEFSLPHIDPLVTGKKSRVHRASSISWSKAFESEKSIPTAPWLKAQIADIECRRWASSAFVGKMIGIRVAREMISHFRAELDIWYRHGDGDDSPTHAMTLSTTPGQRHHHRVKLHREFLDELCTPLCEQFQVDRNYVYEAALAVMHPHAYLHIVEVCFLLSELGRVSTLHKWVKYVSLSMLHSCSTFASCSIAEDVYRDWEGLTIQLCYILNLDAQRQISIPAQVVAHISVAVRTGIIFLGWARQRSDIVRQAVTLPFYTCGTVNSASNGESGPPLSAFAFEKNMRLLCRLLQRPTTSTNEMRKTHIFEGNLGYTFLGAVAARQASDDNISLLSWGGIENAASQNQFKIRKMYTLILMVSVLRTLYARAAVFLSTYQQEIDVDAEGVFETDISSSLFTPQKLWKALGEGPLEGLKRWYALIESHLRCEFDYSVKEVPCLCGLYGLDTAAFEEAAAASRECKELNCREGHDDNVETSGDGTGNGNGTVDPGVGIKKNDVTAAAPVESEDATEDESQCSLQAFLREIGMSFELHTALVNASDDYVLLLMRNDGFGVRTTLRRFRIDPRVFVKSFVLRDAFGWFARHEIFSGETEADTIAHIHAFLSRCCKQRKLRLLVAHRGEDAQMFPLDRHHVRPHQDSDADTNTSDPTLPRSRLPSAAGSVTSDTPTSRPRVSSPALGLESSSGEALPGAFYLQSIMFVDPWEVEAEWNVRRYMHNAQAPLHVELGWDRLSPICLETCDGIVDSVFEDPDLVEMWRTTGGEGWLVTAITQYRLDGLHSYRTLHQHIQRGLAGTDEPRIPLLVEIYSRSQRNAMFEEAGLPHRFIGVITVELVEAKELIPCSWIGTWSDAYVFMELCHVKDKPRETAEEWSLQTYRSSVGEGGVNPRWSLEENQFVFRFAIPTHGKHTAHPTRGVHFSNGGAGVRKVDGQASRMASQLWNADVNDLNRDAVDALEKLLPSLFSGPPAMLRCTVYQKNKVLSHQFMGRTKTPLDELTSGNPMDCWMPLEDTTSGSLHVRISLSFQLMCSSMAGQPEHEDLR
ncbi:regulator of (H+)-ATPase in vacuolar membrane [Phytophthora pseudosyringae]|uniref:Regulator of (H+)-ATPase in vacuolar membrane n=1 Tax=Phytophthora pseudosyringae TaxID=221518 RepID=A0A8T1W4N7_9STRA|nr:regulator of (H+)-ATPase in vacuolar membrane [Phytophthora pseudosyringae]